jgi:hypothetical protein
MGFRVSGLVRGGRGDLGARVHRSYTGCLRDRARPAGWRSGSAPWRRTRSSAPLCTPATEFRVSAFRIWGSPYLPVLTVCGPRRRARRVRNGGRRAAAATGLARPEGYFILG